MSTLDYRATLNLPTTSFAMKAELPKREPDRVAWWREHDIFARRLARNKATGAAPWVLHDGPPYANGALHMGHFLNMVLKDMFVKIALLDGKWTPFIPGWDMHGLPIELETLKHLGIKDFHSIDPLQLRAKCKERAMFWLDRQRSTRMRMGTFADFEHPYRTVDASYEATIVEALAGLAEQGQLYKGLRSTLWCIHDETALAEAEIEYEEKTSPSIYVRFRADAAQRAALLQRFGVPDVAAASVGFLIWTTTPWTLPANVAIALRSDADYGLYRIDDELLIVAVALAESAFGPHFERAKLLATASGEALDSLAVRHPFADRDSQIVLADYVDLATGTGAVHTAPGHGADDFATGVKYDLPILCPVDAKGHFTVEAGVYAGLEIFSANARIIADLQASGALWHAREFKHSYPHCWRCHNPVIFRATAQWFIAMDQNRLRSRAVEAAGMVSYEPAWGQGRLTQMLENHPEWCISRQRTWGTPIPAVVCTACGESILDARVARAAAARFAEHGADIWWSDDIASYLPKGFACPNCAGMTFEKEKNIVDIWFESGVSHLAVLGKNDIPWPGDLVLEGGDQYRGWFRSSIVTAVALKGEAPYRTVVKNGWVNDEQGRPMSKSKGTGIDADDAMAKWGADVLRLWSASVEFVDDVRFGPNVVDQVGRVYRNLRNRLRFMLGNIEDLPVDALVAREAMTPLDRLACEIGDSFLSEVKANYHRYAIHDAYLRLVEFESSMSTLYFDALKDPLYSDARNGVRRRSAQSALLHLLKTFAVALAPVVSFTAEEAWQAIPAGLRDGAESVFDASFGTLQRANEATLHLWDVLRDLRARVAAGDPRDFEARVHVTAGEDIYDRLHDLGDGLREALVVSDVHLERASGSGIIGFEHLRADGEKCARCWKFRTLDTQSHLCEPCAHIVGAG